MSLMADNNCDAAYIVKESIKSILSSSSREALSEIVGGLISKGVESVYAVSVNYRAYNFSDRYEVIIQENGCQLISMRLIDINRPVQEGEDFWLSNTKNLLIRTKIDESTLWEENKSWRGNNNYVTHLSLPDFSLYTNEHHMLAINQERERYSQRDIIAQIIKEASIAGGYLDINYSIDIENKYWVDTDYPSNDPNSNSWPSYVYPCMRYYGQKITATFPQGLILHSVKYEFLGEVDASFCNKDRLMLDL